MTDFDFDEEAFLAPRRGGTRAQWPRDNVAKFGEALRKAHEQLQEQLAPPDGLVERVTAVALQQGFRSVRLERRVVDPSPLEQQRNGPHEIVEWVAIVETGRGELTERVEIPESLPLADSWSCQKCSAVNPNDIDDCARCDGSMAELSWIAAFRALGVDA